MTKRAGSLETAALRQYRSRITGNNPGDKIGMLVIILIVSVTACVTLQRAAVLTDVT